MKICLLGNNLTNLLLANILIKKNIKVDLFYSPTSIVLNTARTIAISNENYKFLKKNIKGINSLGWPTKHIKIYSEKESTSELFEFKNHNQNNFYLVKYSSFFNILKKNKLINKIEIKNYDYQMLKKKNYDLIINSVEKNSISKKYFQKRIQKDYKSLAHTAIIKHKKVENNTATQIFTKNGPLAFLPLSENQTSVVFSNNSTKKIEKKKFYEIIKNYNLKYKINYISEIEYFSIKFSVLRNYSFKNILSFGDLLHKIHPLAGQGFNMTIRDIKILSKIIDENILLGISDGELIAKKFQKNTQHLNFIFSVGIDLINTFFKTDNKIDNKLSRSLSKFLKNNKYLNKYATTLSNKGIF